MSGINYQTPVAEQFSRVVYFDPCYTENVGGRYARLQDAYAVADFWQRKMGEGSKVALFIGNTVAADAAVKALTLGDDWNPDVVLVGLSPEVSKLGVVTVAADKDVVVDGVNVAVEEISGARNVTLNGVVCETLTGITGETSAPATLVWDRTNKVFRAVYIEDGAIKVEDLPV